MPTQESRSCIMTHDFIDDPYDDDPYELRAVLGDELWELYSRIGVTNYPGAESAPQWPWWLRS